MCTHEKIACPHGEDSWDCTSFCDICEGEGEYCPVCEPVPDEVVRMAFDKVIEREVHDLMRDVDWRNG